MDYEELNPQGIDPEEARELSVRANGVRWWPTFKAAASDLLDTNLVSPDQEANVESASSCERWKAMMDDPELAAGDGGGHYSTVDLVEVKDVPARDSMDFIPTIDSDEPFSQAQVQSVYRP